MATHNFCFYLQNRLIQTSQTGGQQYSDASPFSIPCTGANEATTNIVRFSPQFQCTLCDSLFIEMKDTDSGSDPTPLKPEPTVTRYPKFQGCQGFAWVPHTDLIQSFLDKNNKLTVSIDKLGLQLGRTTHNFLRN